MRIRTPRVIFLVVIVAIGASMPAHAQLSGIFKKAKEEIIDEVIEEAKETVAHEDATPAEIMSAQSMLNELGFDAGESDGVMRKKTKLAIYAYEKEQGLPSSGRVDKELIMQLEKSVYAQKSSKNQQSSNSTNSAQSAVSSIASANSSQTAQAIDELNFLSALDTRGKYEEVFSRIRAECEAIDYRNFKGGGRFGASQAKRGQASCIQGCAVSRPDRQVEGWEQLPMTFHNRAIEECKAGYKWAFQHKNQDPETKTVAAVESAKEPAQIPQAEQKIVQGMPPHEPSPTKQEDVSKTNNAADPFLAFCQSEKMHRYYDCNCMAEKAPALRIELTQGFESSPEGQFELNRLRQYREMLANESDPEKKVHIQRGIIKTEDSIARAKNPSLVPMSLLALRLGQTAAPECKSGDYLQQITYSQCTKKANRFKPAQHNGLSLEEDCSCIAENVVNRWMADNNGMSSNWITNMTAQAHRTCH